MAGRNFKTQRWQKLTRYVVRRDSGICHLCSHGGSDSADHLIPVSTITDPVECERLKYESANLRASHFKPCPVCGVRCQIVRGHHTVDVGREKIRLKAIELGRAPVQEVVQEPEGRDIW